MAHTLPDERDERRVTDPGSPESLSLYYSPYCPFCMDVLRELSALDIEVELRNVRSSPEQLAELVQAMGRRTVPVLRVERAGEPPRWIPESLDVIEYLRGLRPGSRRPSQRLLGLWRIAPLALIGLSLVSPTTGLAAGLAGLALALLLARHLPPAAWRWTRRLHLR